MTRARALGLPYEPAETLASAPTAEILRRLDLLTARQKLDDQVEVAALLGGVSQEVPLLSELLDEYSDNRRTYLATLSDDQKRKWRNPKQRVIKDLKSLLGDKSINQITRSDALLFLNWWQDRITDEGLDPGTANKAFSHISAMVKQIDQMKSLGLAPVFEGLRIEGASKEQRVPFSNKHIRDVLLRTGAFDDLNEQARRIVFVCVETGMRPSEVCNLTPDTIFLDAAVPYVAVRAQGRRTKTMASIREIPLVGVALMSIREQPHGFPRYRDKSASWSALVDKFMKNAGLMETDEHTAYGLRHSFADRLTAVRCTDEEKDRLMGHSGEFYGIGPSLEHKAEILGRIVFNPPERV